MKIICFGDSLTTCGGEGGRFSDILQARFPGHAFINNGAGGEAFPEARKRLRADVLAEKPDIVLVEYGANDWWRDERPYTAWAEDLDYLLGRIRKAGARAMVLGVFGDYRNAAGELVVKEYGADARGFAYRALEESVARKHGCPYVANMQERIVGDRRCWSDSNHPNEYGNRYVADTIEHGLAELLGEPPRPVRKPHLETTRDCWREAAALAPERLAVVDGERRLTYGEADAIVETLAANIATVTGVQRPTVAVYLPNGLEYYLIYWATQRLGGVIVPLNTWLKEESLAGIFRMVEPSILFVRGPQDEYAVRAGQGMPIYATEPLLPGPPPRNREEGVPGIGNEKQCTASSFLPREGGQGVRSLRPYAELLKATPPAPETPLTGDDLSIIMHTSGTTATPKGALMRHADLMFNVAAAINAHNFSTDDVHLLVNPMFHCTALYSSLPTAAYQKTPVIIVPTTDPEELMKIVERERITTFLSIPSVFQKILLLPDLDRCDASSLRVLAYAGSPMPVATIRELRRRFPAVALHNFFGLTETISMTHVLRNDDVEAHPDSIGRLLPFVEAIVVDEDDHPVPPGMPGELLFAREEIIPGYFQQPTRLWDALVELNGRLWFRTGDLAAVDEEGFWTVKGRKKDMIIVGGENVFAAEVEAILLAHDKVREAAVKGIPATGVRSYLGELVKAYIVRGDASLTELELKKHCYERLPSYKVPAFFAFMDALPRNPSGKVVKDELP